MLGKITALFVSLITALSPFTPRDLSNKTLPTPTPKIINSQNKQTKIISLSNFPYNLYLQPLPEKVTLKIIPNYDEPRLSSEALVKNNNCTLGINAGFYDQENKPLGLLKIKNQELSPRIKSPWLNGFVWQTEKDSLDFGLTPPSTNKTPLSFIFQTGPYISLGTNPDKTSSLLENSKLARRMLIAKNKENQIFLIAVFDKNNQFSGPTLAQLSQIFTDPALKDYQITEIINLDGGSASTFYGIASNNSPLILKEFSPLGALLCGH